MRSSLFALLLIPLVLSCAGPPPITPAGMDRIAEVTTACTRLFPDASWQMVHRIDTTLAGGSRGTLMGVTVISPRTRTVKCALMSLEGLVLFQAVDADGRMTVARAVPPFDKPVFARGMIGDIRMLFLHPKAPPLETGFTETGLPLCRYVLTEHGTLDVERHPRGEWVLRRYDRHRLIRTVRMMPADPPVAGSPDAYSPAAGMVLTASGPAHYTIQLKLIEASPLGTPDPDTGGDSP